MDNKNIIKLYHFSNNDIKDKLKVNFFGYNYYTNNSKNLSKVKRLYFYFNKNKIEHRFKFSKFLYIVKVDKRKLYDLDLDKLNLVNNTNDIYSNIKKLGYLGLISKRYNQVVIFRDIKIYKKILL